MIKKIGLVVVFITAFIGLQYFVEKGVESYQTSQGRNIVEAQVSNIIKEAEALSSEKPKSIAIHEVSTNMLEKRLNAINSPQEKRDQALSMFMGYYLTNHRTRSDYCNKLGINISTFTKRFDELHQNEITLSKQHVFKRASEIEKLYKVAKPGLEKFVQQDMADMSAAYSVTTTGVCKLIEQNGIAFAEHMIISKIQSSVYKAIHHKN